MPVELHDRLKILRLPGVRDSYRELAEEARAERHSYEQYLGAVIQREWEQRLRWPAPGLALVRLFPRHCQAPGRPVPQVAVAAVPRPALALPCQPCNRSVAAPGYCDYGVPIHQTDLPG